MRSQDFFLYRSPATLTQSRPIWCRWSQSMAITDARKPINTATCGGIRCLQCSTKQSITYV